MDDSTKLRSKELTRIARTEFAREQADALAFVDRNREIVELPPGLENGQTRKRMRGARTDSDCIDEICEIVAQGITATAIFIDKCEHVSLLASKLSTCKANKLFRSQFCIVTHLTKTPRVESRSENSVLPQRARAKTAATVARVGPCGHDHCPARQPDQSRCRDPIERPGSASRSVRRVERIIAPAVLRPSSVYHAKPKKGLRVHVCFRRRRG